MKILLALIKKRNKTDSERSEQYNNCVYFAVNFYPYLYVRDKSGFCKSNNGSQK